MSLPYSRSEVKERARSEWRGACNVTLPSFTSDFSDLNAQAIRHDVQLAAKHGFWGTLVASESGTTVDEYVRFLELAAEAAPADFRLVAHLSFSTVDEALRVADAAEGIGIEAGLLSYPPGFNPRRPADIVEHTRYFAERTDLALILFAVMTWGWSHLHPSGVPPEALEEMSRLETAAALKYEAGGTAMMASFAEVHRRCSEHLIVENPMEQYMPALVPTYDIPWIGTSGYEALGDRVPQVLAALQAGEHDRAMEIFWSCQPAREAKGAFHATFKGANLIHRVGWKYLGWLQGYSGGLLRMPQMRLTRGQMRQLRGGLAAAGFEIPDDDRGFAAGRFPA
jgi:dihydrodipicolinate synthase/N-acetylneuraminate lyase